MKSIKLTEFMNIMLGIMIGVVITMIIAMYTIALGTVNYCSCDESCVNKLGPIIFQPTIMAIIVELFVVAGIVIIVVIVHFLKRKKS